MIVTTAIGRENGFMFIYEWRVTVTEGERERMRGVGRENKK